MPAAPNLPTAIVAGSTPGHATDHVTIATVLNRIHLGTISSTKTTAYTLTQANADEVVPVNSSSAVAVTVPVLAQGTIIRVQRVGSGAVNFTPAGVSILVADGYSSSPAAQTSVVELIWTTGTTVVARGDITPVATIIDGGTP